jgi:arginase
MRELVLIEAPSNLGLKEPMPGVEPGVKYFPAAMAKEKLSENAGIKTKLYVAAPGYDGITDEETGVKNAAKVIDYSRKLASTIEAQLEKNKLCVVIGGDCSILIGAALALKRNGHYGLFYLDGHTDYVLPSAIRL